MNTITVFAVIVFLTIILKALNSRGGLKREAAKQIISDGGVVIDVRSSGEFKSGHYKGAYSIDHGSIVQGVKKHKIKKDTPIILYCASGSRSSVARNALLSQGYTLVYNAGNLAKLKRLLA